MAVEVIDTLKPKNGQEFSVAEAVDIAFNGEMTVKEKIDALQTQVDTLATDSEVATALELKANTSTVNTALALKANVSDVNTALSAKANASDVNTALALKADAATYANGISYLGTKATLAEIQAITPTIASGEPTHQYFCSADSHYYTWDGTAWTDTGTMNSAASEVEAARSGSLNLKSRIDTIADDLSNEKQGYTLYFAEQAMIGNLSDVDPGYVTLNNNRCVIVNAPLAENDIIGFEYGKCENVQFAVAPFLSVNFIEVNGEVWRSEEIKIQTAGSYSFMFKKSDDTSFTAGELSTIGQSFGSLYGRNKINTRLYDRINIVTAKTETQISELSTRSTSTDAQITDLTNRTLGSVETLAQQAMMGNVSDVYPGYTTGNNNRCVIINITLAENDIVGFKYGKCENVQFAVAPFQSINFIEVNGEAWRSEEFKVQTPGTYSFMFKKSDNSNFTTEEVSTVAQGFGKLYSVDTVDVLIYDRITTERKGRMNGKKLVGIGDSFMEVYAPNTTSWLNLIAEKNDMTVYNGGLSSSCIADNANQTVLSFVDRIDAVLSENVSCDYFVLIGGHNDSNAELNGGTAIPIGADSDTVTTTYKGALNTIITKVINKYPTCHILLLSPFNRRGTEKPYLTAMEEIAEKYNLMFFNNMKGSGICFQNDVQRAQYDLNLTLHPNDKGHERLSNIYESLLKNM